MLFPYPFDDRITPFVKFGKPDFVKKWQINIGRGKGKNIFVQKPAEGWIAELIRRIIKASFFDEGVSKMKKIGLIFGVLALGACAMSEPQVKETYPYGMTEAEWNQLSIKDKTKIRRDFYFYEKGQVNFVNPDMDIEGKKELPNVYERRNTRTQRATATTAIEQ